MKKSLVAVLLSSSISLTAFAGPGADAISAAKAEMDKANKVGYLWRDTGKILKKAEEALAKGDEDKAAKIAGKAKKQALLAQEQAEAQANAGPLF